MELIQSTRVRKGMSRSDLGKAIGCGPAMVGHIERGVRKLTPERAIAIERALGIDRAKLLPELFRRSKVAA